MATPILLFSNLYRFLGFGGSAQYTGEQLPGPMISQGGPVQVREDNAMALSAVFNCVRIITETVSGLPMHVQRQRAGEWREQPLDELASMLTFKPNPFMTAVDFWESVLFNLVLRGNGYAKIIRNSAGMPIALYPLASAQVQPIVLKDGTGWYIYNLDGYQTMFADEDILHFRIFGNGRVGLSPIQYGARTIGLGIAADTYAGMFYTRGGRAGGVLQIDRILTPKQRAELRESFKEVHEGVESAHKLFVLEAGMKYQQVQLSPEDAQLLESRKFNVRDIARFWGVPAFLLNESEGSTSWGTGLEQQMLGFYNLIIRPYTRRISATLQMKLVPAGQQRNTRVLYDFEELMGADSRTKAEYYTKLTNGGLMTRNEGRVKLGLPRHTEPNADTLTVQGAMLPIGKLGQKPAVPAGLPAPAKDDDEPKEDKDA